MNIKNGLGEIGVRVTEQVQLSAMVVFAVILSACDSTTLPGDESDERVSITNNQASLDVRVSYAEEAVAIDTGAVPKLPASALVSGAKAGQLVTTRVLAANAKPSVSLRLIAEIESPVVEGEVVQATSVTLSKFNAAMVSYNMRGAPRLGAIDWISYFKTNRPRLSSSAAFNDSDINAVTTDGFNVYTVAATEAPEFASPAVLEKFRLRFGKMILEENARLQLSSFAGTSVTHANDVVYTTSGDNGHVSAFNDRDMSKLAEFALHDARWVAWDEQGDRMVVAQGTPGQLSIFEAGGFSGGSMNLLNSFPFPGANVAESKSTVEISGGKAFIAAGPDGVQIMCLDDGQILGSVPRPDPVALGLDPAVVVTNAVTVDDDLMFISNGEAGVYVAQASNDFDKTSCSDPVSITVLGKIQFDSLQSANHVAYVDNYLYVAAGLGGVKVVRVSTD